MLTSDELQGMPVKEIEKIDDDLRLKNMPWLFANYFPDRSKGREKNHDGKVSVELASRMSEIATKLTTFVREHIQSTDEKSEPDITETSGHTISVIPSNAYFSVKGEDLKAYKTLLIESVLIKQEIAAIIESESAQ